MITMGELGGEPTNDDLLEYTTKKELDMIFSFEHKYCFSKKFKIKRRKVLNSLKYKEKLSSNSGWSVLFWLNHDYPRLISKIRGEEDPKNAQICLATLMYMLKGTPVIYNGEEIGMSNYNFECKFYIFPKKSFIFYLKCYFHYYIIIFIFCNIFYV